MTRDDWPALAFCGFAFLTAVSVIGYVVTQDQNVSLAGFLTFLTAILATVALGITAAVAYQRGRGVIAAVTGALGGFLALTVVGGGVWLAAGEAAATVTVTYLVAFAFLVLLVLLALASITMIRSRH